MPPGDSSPSERLRLWLEAAPDGYFLRDAASGEPVRWSDPRLRVVPVAGASYRMEALQDDAFAPGRRLQAGYVPAEVAPELRGDEQAVALREFRDASQRVGLRVLIAPADAWIQEPRR